MATGGGTGAPSVEEFVLQDKNGRYNLSEIYYISEVEPTRRGGKVKYKFYPFVKPEAGEYEGRLLKKGEIGEDGIAANTPKDSYFVPRDLLLREHLLQDQGQVKPDIDEELFTPFTGITPLKYKMYPGPYITGEAEEKWELKPAEGEEADSGGDVHMNCSAGQFKSIKMGDGDIVLTGLDGMPVVKFPDGTYWVNVRETVSRSDGTQVVQLVWRSYTKELHRATKSQVLQKAVGEAKERELLSTVKTENARLQDEVAQLTTDKVSLEENLEALQKGYDAAESATSPRRHAVESDAASSQSEKLQVPGMSELFLYEEEEGVEYKENYVEVSNMTALKNIIKWGVCHEGGGKV